MMGGAPPEPWLSLVGIGEDGVAGLSPAACRLIAGASCVVGGRRHLALAEPLIIGTRLTWQTPIEATLPDILSERGGAVCVLATGDPFHYGIGTLLSQHVPANEMRCLPQPSAFSLVAARLGWSLQDCACVSLHGRALNRIIPVLQHAQRVIALSWDGATPRHVADLLTARGFGASTLWVCEALSGPTERVRTTRADAFDLNDIADLNTVGLEVVVARQARVLPATPGLPDDWFEHDGQLTKSSIRAVTLSALAPHPGETLCDIGAGSGSVSIEWLLAAPSTRSFAIEHQAERVGRIRRNAEHWGVADRLTIVHGSAPEALQGLPQADAVFVGGGLTRAGLLDAGCAALRPGGRLVSNAVTIESQALLSRMFGTQGGDLLTLSFARAEPVGNFHGFRPAMPVMQWRWVKP